MPGQPQTTKYRLAWRSRVTNYRGSGTAPMSLAEAQEWCREMNSSWPDIEHWPDPILEPRNEE